MRENNCAGQPSFPKNHGVCPGGFDGIGGVFSIFIFFVSAMDEGYPKIAWRMANVPDLAIFRRFQALNLQNLLYLQAELVHLEGQLEQAAAADAQSADARCKLYSRDWFTLRSSHAIPDCDGRQWAIFLDIRSKLKEYSQCSLP